MCTYSIGVGEVSGISQPAAEVVVRASPAWHQQRRRGYFDDRQRLHIMLFLRKVKQRLQPLHLNDYITMRAVQYVQTPVESSNFLSVTLLPINVPNILPNWIKALWSLFQLFFSKLQQTVNNLKTPCALWTRPDHVLVYETTWNKTNIETSY